MDIHGGIDERLLGKKIFFLYPSALIQNRIAGELLRMEFEVYVAKDPTKLRRTLKQFPHSLVFANLDAGMEDDEWEAWIRWIQNEPATAAVGVGVIAIGDKRKERFTTALRPRCGYIELKPNVNATIQTIARILTAEQARGRRRFLRVETAAETNTTVNISVNREIIRGTVKDISTAGFACVFDDAVTLVKDEVLHDMQLRLQSQLIMAEGVALGSRTENGQTIHVILFSDRTQAEMRDRVRAYIRSALQARMEPLLS